MKHNKQLPGILVQLNFVNQNQYNITHLPTTSMNRVSLSRNVKSTHTEVRTVQFLADISATTSALVSATNHGCRYHNLRPQISHRYKGH